MTKHDPFHVTILRAIRKLHRSADGEPSNPDQQEVARMAILIKDTAVPPAHREEIAVCWERNMQIMGLHGDFLSVASDLRNPHRDA